MASRSILRFYLPLAISWLFMGLEGPICIKVISNLSDSEVHTAAFSILMSVALWIESPVIDLLATSTTLGTSRDRYVVLSRFVWYMMAWVTVAHALITFSPLYYVVTQDILGVTARVAEAARPGMALMVFWSAFIGWRRYLQGILIRQGRTKIIGIGTSVRVSTIVLVTTLLFILTKLDGVIIASSALMISVAAEASFIHVVSRQSVKDLDHQPSTDPVSLRRLAQFHFPLTATTMVKLLVSPIVIAGLARTQEPVLSIAAFQVANTVLFLFRALGFCLPEVVIALYKDPDARSALKRFCFGIAAGTSGTMLLLAALGIDTFIFGKLLNAKPDVTSLAHWMFLATALAPALDACQSYVRGVLTAHHLTASRLIAVVVSVSCLLLAIRISVALGLPGPAIAGIGLTVSLSAELLVLAVSWLHAQRRRDLSFA